jgi:FMN phosphatase YigB (HAD superfamily)
MPHTVSVIVTDLDNTLYDWFDIWYSSFRPMLDVLVSESGVPEHELKREIRTIHQRYGTSEYSRLIDELTCLASLQTAGRFAAVHEKAIAAFREGRRSSLRLYPTVFETLWSLKKTGCLIIGYTESRAFYTNYRVRRLCLDGLLDFLHSPADHNMPEGVTRESIRRYPPEAYDLRVTQHHHTPEGAYKPNPDILRKIISDVGADQHGVIYIGDSEMKDIAMAKDAGVTDVFAAYGAVQHKEQYRLLQDVSHWTDADVQREMEIKKRGRVDATYVLEKHFSEVLNLFKFVPFKTHAPIK